MYGLGEVEEYWDSSVQDWVVVVYEEVNIEEARECDDSELPF